MFMDRTFIAQTLVQELLYSCTYYGLFALIALGYGQ